MILYGKTYDPCCAWVLGLSMPSNRLRYLLFGFGFRNSWYQLFSTARYLSIGHIFTISYIPNFNQHQLQTYLRHGGEFQPTSVTNLPETYFNQHQLQTYLRHGGEFQPTSVTDLPETYFNQHQLQTYLRHNSTYISYRLTWDMVGNSNQH